MILWLRVANSIQNLTKTREDEGRKKLQHKPGLEPAALYRTNRLAAKKANLQLTELSSFLKKEAIKPSKVITRSEETRETVLGNYPAYI